jgi:hypothetical protein
MMIYQINNFPFSLIIHNVTSLLLLLHVKLSKESSCVRVALISMRVGSWVGSKTSWLTKQSHPAGTTLFDDIVAISNNHNVFFF